MPARSRLWPDPRVKPPYGAAELDRGHPLAQFLSIHWVMNEGGGATVLDPVRAQHGTLSGTTKPFWQPGPRALGLEFDGTSSYIVNKTALNTARVTLAAQFRVRTFPGGRGFVCGFSIGNNAGQHDRHLSVQSSTVEFKPQGTTLTDTSTIVVNQPYIFAATMEAGLTVRLYRDGQQTVTGTASGADTGYAGPNVMAGGSYDSAFNYLHQAMDWMGVWTEPLPANHVLWLAKEPYAIYRPIVRRRYSVPTGPVIPVLDYHRRQMMQS